MSKKLPYYQFEPAEHLAGDIQMCTLAAQGLFENIKSIYWIKGCELTLKQLNGRFKEPELIKELIDQNILKLANEEINILFLDNQYEEILLKKKILSDAGKKGWLAKKAKATLKPPLSEAKATLKHLDKIREDNKELNGEFDNSPVTFDDKYKAFIDLFNDVKGQITGSKGKFKGESKSKAQFKVLLKSYKGKEITKAILAMFRDSHHIDNGYKYATPELLTRADKFPRFYENA